MPLELSRVWRLLWGNFGVLAVLDILLVAVAIYYLLLLVKGTRAFQLLKGLLVYGILILLASLLQLRTLTTILNTMLLPGVIVLIVLFAPELRLGLEQIGRGRLIPSLPSMKKEEISRVVNEIVSAVSSLSKARIGALIAIEGHVGLNDIITTGKLLRGHISADLLRTIFYPGTPLHDLAVVVRGDRLMAAGCLFPLSEREDKAFTLGTRHRAALGLSETSDALVVVVSEETGAVSFANEGRLYSNLSSDALKAKLLNVLTPPEKKKHARVPGLRGLWRRIPLEGEKRTDGAPKP